MYAQLCLRLNSTSPNFEEPTSQTTTFRRLLLSKCKEEFENRTRTSAVSEVQDGGSQEDEEQRAFAKRKILGNIKFTGELYKLAMLHESIVHQCIKELLEKKRSINDMCDNIECVCSLMTTVGQKLDTQKARGWTDKYFSRMKTLSENKELPPRIRFMLLDTIELRQSKWVPRKVKAEISPQPIQRARHPSPANSPIPSPLPSRHQHRPPQGSPYLAPHPPLSSRAPPDHPSPTPKTEPPPTSEVSVPVPAETRLRKLPSGKSGSNVSLRPSAPARKFQNRVKPPPAEQPTAQTSTQSEAEAQPSSNNGLIGEGPTPKPPPGKGPAPPSHPVPSHPPSFTPPMQVLVRGAPPPPGHMNTRPVHMAAHPGHMTGAPLPPRPAYIGPYPPPLPGVIPPPMYPHWVTPPLVAPPIPRPPGPIPPSTDQSPVVPSPPLSLHRGEAPPIKHVSKLGKKVTTTTGPAGTKKGAKNEKIDHLIHQLLSSHDVAGVAAAIERVTPLESSPHHTATLLITRTLQLSEDERCEVSELLKKLHSDSYLDSRGFIKAVSSVLSSLSQNLADYPQHRNAVATLVARGVAQEVVSLKEALAVFTQGAHHPTSLIMLQALSNLIGQGPLQSLFRESGFRMMSLFPPADQSLDTVSQLLEARSLIFLFPLKKLQRDLISQLEQENVSAAAVYKWMKTNVDPSLYHTPEFIILLTQCVLEHATRASISAPSKENLAVEKQLMEEFKVLLQKLVMENHSLQLMVLSATQVFCHNLDFPKGLVLRLFACWYDTDVVDEEAFMMWKDDLSRDLPGKERTLFQVNQWLSILEEEDSEDEEA